MGDYGSGEEIGVATVEYTSANRQLHHHWITFPDGQVRKEYNYRSVEPAVVEEMDAFDMLPRLKVTYRPVAGAIGEYSEMFLFFWVALLCVLVIDGAVMLICHQFLGQSAIDVIYNTKIGKFIQDAIWLAFGITGGLSLICGWMHFRYNEPTRDDAIPKEWERAQLKKIGNEEHGW